MSKVEKNKLLKNTFKDVYCRLKPSGISGVGVFAIKTIPINTNPFKKCNINSEKVNYISVKKEELKNLDSQIMDMVKDFFHEDKGYFPIALNGLNSIDITFYLNHSDNPNIEIINEDNNYFSFITKREIRVGEELFINYNIYDEKVN